MQITPRTRRILTLAWAVSKGFFWPVTIAVCIIAYSAIAPWQPSKGMKEALKSFFAILFFIMFFYGQYKRVEKQTDDKDAFGHVKDQLVSLQELVRGIKPTQTGSASFNRAAAEGANSLLMESRILLESGHALAALLQGGVAFEHALRGFARHFKGEEAAKGPLHSLISRMAPEELAGELHALRVIRNRLTHISENELVDLPDADRVLTGFEWAVSELAQIVHRDTAA